MALFPSASSFACKFCHFFPLCVVDCPKQIYYVVHRLPLIIRMTIHLKVHKHPMADGKCRESVNKIKRLIAHLIQRYLQFSWVLTKPSLLHICLMIVAMALWSFWMANMTRPQVPWVTQKGSKELDLRNWLETWCRSQLPTLRGVEGSCWKLQD
jgi:hypothetical protein